MRSGHKSLPVLVLALMPAASPLLGAAARTSNSHRTGSPHTFSSASHRRYSSSRRTQSAHHSRKPNAYARLAKMQIDPSRVENIQRALSVAGMYRGTPTGQWDSGTRDAMARYQAQNGFGVTGLPDAKSLMKLGLGPHPLPSELDKTRALNFDPNPSVAANPLSGTSSTTGEARSAPNAAGSPPAQHPPER
jgi:Putative peptidoglycan binding domain